MDSAGKTPGCKACDSGKGKHSVACQARYSEWLESHDVSASGSKVVVSPSPGAAEPDLMINRKLLGMSTFLRLRKDQMVRRLQFLIGAVMIVRSKGRLKWSLHLILTLPGDAQRASPGWMFLEFVTMLSVERSELVFKLNHHLQGPR